MDLKCDELKELSKKINSLHLCYLEGNERSNDETRARLIKHIKEFLCLAPHSAKFQLQETREVLRRSVNKKSNFSGIRAARAWSALAKYADNLIVAPWRKEYREIKLYCGFYKHEVEAGLYGADIMLEAMGYRRGRNSTMILEDILDPDQLTSVSKDALFAHVECIILDEVWKQVEKHGIGWANILDYREQYIGTPDQTKRTLVYFRHHDRTSTSSCQGYDYNIHSYPVHYSPQGSLPYNMTGYVGSSHLPPHAVYPTYVNPHCSAIPHPSQCYSNGYNYQYSSSYNHPNSHVCPQPYVPTYPVSSIVPTAKLIELETPPYNHQHYNPPYTSFTDRVSDSQFLSRKAKDDGAGEWEEWDNIYKLSRKKESSSSSYNDENQLSDGMRGMNLAQSSISRRYDNMRSEGDGEVRSRVNRSSFELEDAVSMHRLTKNSYESESEAAKIKKSKRKVDENHKSINVENEERKPARTLPQNEYRHQVNEEIFSESSKPRQEDPTFKRETNIIPSRSNGVENCRSLAQEAAAPLVVTLDVSPAFIRDIGSSVTYPAPERWECTTCTYLNSTEARVCEMCAKSRVSSEIKLPQVGGKECPNCTLINDRGKNFCEACRSSLKDSPTHI